MKYTEEQYIKSASTQARIIDELNTEFTPKNYTVEGYAIDEVVKNKQLLIKIKDISKVEVKKVIK